MSMNLMGFFARFAAAACLALLAVGADLPATAQPSGPHLEMGVARWGGDFQRFAVLSGKPQECAAACQNDEKCRSWTYVRPGVEGPSAFCRLKASVPFAASDPCCVSGISAGASLGILAGYEDSDTANPQIAAAKPAPSGITASIAKKPNLAQPKAKPQPASGPPMQLTPKSW